MTVDEKQTLRNANEKKFLNQISLIVHSQDQTCQWYSLLP